MNFPIGAGLLMDHFGYGSPFLLSGVLVLLTLTLTTDMDGYARPKSRPAEAESQTVPERSAHA